MKARLFTFSLLILCGLSQPLAAQSHNRFTLDMLRCVVDVGSPQLSPDGKSIAFVVTRGNYTDNRNESDLYIIDIGTKTVRPLTADRKDVSEQRWSPDGNTLAFLAPDNCGKSQIWLMPMRGGDSHQFTSSPNGVNHYAWRPDGRAIAFAASDSAPKREGEAEHVRAFHVGYQDLFLRENVQPQHIWLQSLDSPRAARLTSGTWSLEFALPPGSPPSHLSWSPDGKQIAFVRAPLPESGRLDSVSVWVVDVTTGKVRSLSGFQRFQNNPSFSPDGKLVAYWYPREGRGDIGWVNDIYVESSAGGNARNLTSSLDRNFYFAAWMPSGKSVLAAANDRTSVGLWLVPIDGAPKRLELGALVVNGAYGYDISVGRTGALAFSATSPNRPSELYLMRSPTSTPVRLTNFNQWADTLRWGGMERLTWKGPDGFDEDGVVTYPPEFSPSSSYPLVLLIHGGPNSASKLKFSALAHLMASEGWIVFMPNYRGSDNLGNAYYTAIVGDWGRGPGRDVMAGIAELRKRPYVDSTRTAVTGWSYGGYMTTWLLGNYPDAWTAGMAGAPLTNFEEEYNLSDGNTMWRYCFSGSPWTGDRAKIYREQSPITYATKIKAPTLIMSNMEDFRVPPTQAMALFHALKDIGVETEFIGFPGRTHVSSDPINSREIDRLWIDWVRTHFGGTGVAKLSDKPTR